MISCSRRNVVPPLSELRVYVVPNRFECEAVGRDVCGGIYFSDIDAIVVSEGGFEGCGEFSVWKHELAHRYGMEADHSNQSDFNACINTDRCDAAIYSIKEYANQCFFVLLLNTSHRTMFTVTDSRTSSAIVYLKNCLGII